MFPIGAFFIGIGTAAAIAAVLAVLLAIADATIANYGEVKISINNGSKELTVDGGRPLLSTLTSEGIFIPSACGGRGSCGLCKLAVKSGAGEYAPTELPWITEADRKANVRLSCQVKVKREMQIVVPEELFSIKQYETTVASIRDLTYDIKEVTLKLKDSQALDFKAGRYVQFVVPAYELTPDPVYRAYSISSSPARKDQVELEIRLVPNGICTTYVFQHLKVGDSVNINGPYGEFHLRDSERDLIFVAGGSGMAPIKSILLDMLERGIRRKATYFFGARAVRDLFLVEEMRELEKKLPGFKFVPALSNPEPGDNWEGEKGLITEVLSRHFERLDHHEAYLCGSPGMIDASIKVFKAKGLPEELIFFDKFA
ncbi:MAG: oxidoreductase [Spirochaetes bacterium GWB1_66_5]|nr:MAG: oxidoreductase [Spirochaetes bacterium GWB1_66_5]